MRIEAERGFITLLITSVLLIGVLIITLGHYRTVFHQIKVAQNEVSGRQAHWKAEAGIECTYSYLRATNKTVTDIKTPATNAADYPTFCSPYSALPSLEIVDVSMANAHVVSATASNYTLHKTVLELSLTGAGAIQSTGPIELVGTVSIKPTAKVTPLSGNEYECVSVAFADEFTYRYDATHGDSGQAQGLEVLDPSMDGPFSGFNGVCHEDYKTVIPKAAGSEYSMYAPDQQGTNPAPFEKDFNPNPDLNPFPNFFGLPKTAQNIEDLSQDTDIFTRVVLSNATSCGTEITNHFTAGQTKGLWIKGNCHINSAVAAISNVSQLLVVQDGVFALNGALAYNGVIYHLVDYQDINVKNHIDDFWEGLATPNVFAPFIKPIHDSSVLKKSVGIQFASGLPAGGLIFDAPAGVSTIVGDMDLDFRSAANPIDPPPTYVWQKGSWNDL